MKKQRSLCYITRTILVLLIFIIGFCSCGKAFDNGMGGASNESYYPIGDTVSKPNADYAGDSSVGIGSIPAGGIDNPSAKIIKTATATINTKEYDSLIENLYKKITEFGGYTDSESFSGSYIRTATITIRIPADKLDGFKEVLSGLGTLTYYNAEKEDVTLTYSVLESRAETLKLEITYVEELFEIAKNKSDLAAIAELEKRLTDIRLEIAEIEAKLNSYDNSIAYSTVKLTVHEVHEYKEPEIEKKGVFKRIGEGLSENLKSIADFFVEFFVWFVTSLPYLIIWAGIITAAIFLIRRFMKKRNLTFFSLFKKKTATETSDSDKSDTKEDNKQE